MSRSGYSDDLDPLELGRWRAQVASAIRGKRGQRMLRDLRVALDALPDRRLVSNSLLTTGGEMCAIGAVAAARGVAVEPADDGPDWYDGEDFYDSVADKLDVAHQLVREVMYLNDDIATARWGRLVTAARWQSWHGPLEDPGRFRWRHLRRWVESKIRFEEAEGA